MKKKYFYNKNDVMEMLEASEKRAKKIIKELNKELEEKGFLYYDKVVNAKYFNERYNIE
ncbi:transcriptional regulator [Leptotrichia sp. HSP-342]|uniref:Transcriptional regulator n=1 Tax=Leptotrichia mesophila TaxID=3239303 RepID=A0AB39VD39_9FUSO